MQTLAGGNAEVSFGIRIGPSHEDAWDTNINIQLVGREYRNEAPVTQNARLMYRNEFTLEFESVITVVRPVFVSFSEFVGKSDVGF